MSKSKHKSNFSKMTTLILSSSTNREREDCPSFALICNINLHPLHPLEWSKRLCGHQVSVRVWYSPSTCARMQKYIFIYVNITKVFKGKLYRIHLRLFFPLLSFRCYSFIGRRGRAQTVSLSRRGCVFQQVIQHEMLHALGFNHEQTRSDRDEHVRIQLQNVMRGESS